MLNQLIVSVAPLIHKRLVDPVFLNDDVKHGQTQGCVGSRADRHPDISQTDIRFHRRLDGDNFGTPLFSRQKVARAVLGRALVNGLLAPDHDNVGVLIIKTGPHAQGVGKGEEHLNGANTAVAVVRATVGN